MAVMLREKTWEKEGVTITFLTYNTMLTLKVTEVLKKAFRFPTPTEDDPDAHSLPTPVQMFYLGMPSIARVALAEDAPLWGIMLKEAVESPTWLDDPVADYRRIHRNAPAEILSHVEDGWLATRESAHLAPADLRKDPPVNPELDIEAVAEGRIDKTDPTTPGTISLTPKSSPVLLNSRKPAKKAR